MPERLIVVSTDCHAGLPIADYKPYVESRYHEVMDMAVPVQLEMLAKAESSFLIKEINDEWRAPIQQQLTGAWDYQERVRMLAMASRWTPREASTPRDRSNQPATSIRAPGRLS